MIEWIVILLIIFCILVWHYSQSTKKYSISQLKESQISTNLTSLWEEHNPVVISDMRPIEIWNSQSLKQTRFWGAQPIWNEYEKDPANSNITHSRSLQTTWSDILGITKIESDLILKWYDLSPILFSTRTEAHIGYEGLRKTYGWSTAISCTQGEMKCILLNSSQLSRLPPGWKGLRWLDATIAHHPLWTQVQTIEIILRPSTVLLIPPHWIIAIEPIDLQTPIWWTRTDLHHPISKWAQKWNEDNT